MKALCRIFLFLGLYRISGLFYIRDPAGYPVSFAGYPDRKTLKSKTVLINKIISIYNRDIHYNSVLFHGQDILYIYILLNSVSRFVEH